MVGKTCPAKELNFLASLGEMVAGEGLSVGQRDISKIIGWASVRLLERRAEFTGRHPFLHPSSFFIVLKM